MRLGVFAIFVVALVVLSSDAFAQSRPDPFEGANEAGEQFLEYFRSTFARTLGALAITGMIIGAIFNVWKWSRVAMVGGGIIAIFLVPEMIDFLAAN